MVVWREGAVDVSYHHPRERQKSDAIDTSERIWVNILGVEQLNCVRVDGKALKHLENIDKIERYLKLLSIRTCKNFSGST